MSKLKIEQDKELRNQVHAVVLTFLLGDRRKKVYAKDLTENLIQLITADRKRVALEARIDELQKYLDHYKDDYDRYADSRIAELKAQQEEV